MEFSSGSHPDGDIYITKLNTPPNELPNTELVNQGYWIINNYGNNQEFSSLFAIEFNEITNTSSITSFV